MGEQETGVQAKFALNLGKLTLHSGAIDGFRSDKLKRERRRHNKLFKHI